MNRLLTSTTLLILTLSILNPCSAEEISSSEHDSVKISEVLQENESDVTTKAKPIDFEEDYQNKKTVASDATVKTAKIENPDNFWIEKFSGKKLNTLKGNLEELQKIYNKNYKTFSIGEAINNTDKADSQQKRNTNLVLNISRQSPFSIYAASYIFPELIKLNIQRFNDKLLETEKNLTDEISETPEEINNLIIKISDDVQKYKSINEAYHKLVIKAEENIKSIKKTNTRLNDLTKLGFYVKKTNDKILDIISKQTDSIGDITNQLEYAIDYSEKQISFINQHNHNIAEKVKYFSEIRSSFKDLELFIERLETKEKYNFYLINKIFSDFHDNLKQQIGKEEIRAGRIYTLIKRSKFVPVHKSVDIFNAKDDLNNIFNLLGLIETDEKLYSVLLPYISDESWQCRYIDEESEKNKDKTEEKPKPKLIDFEED